jgi:hypothetical protein
VIAPASVQSFAARLTWLLLAVLIALGGAGLVAAMDHVPGTPSRAEMTWAGDEAARPALDKATVQLEQLASAVDTLGTTARLALAQVVAGELDSLQDTLARGTIELGAVDAQSKALDASLVAVPGTGDGAALRLSADLRQRFDELGSARMLTIGLAADWATFTGRADDAAKLFGLLSEHDQQTAAAAKQGSAAHYAAALKELVGSDATMAKVNTLRDHLASTTDVSTLDEWLRRLDAYDAALRTLYQGLLDSKGRLTNAIREAFSAEEAALAELPADNRGLVLIMSDVARGGLNQAVISIEQARGALASALELQQQMQSGVSPSPQG